MRSKKYLRNFEKTPPKNALPFQTSEGVNSEPRKRKPFTCTLKTEYTGHEDFISDEFSHLIGYAETSEYQNSENSLYK